MKLFFRFFLPKKDAIRLFFQILTQQNICVNISYTNNAEIGIDLSSLYLHFYACSL